MAKKIILSNDIPSIETEWDNGAEAYSGEAIERFLKAQLTSKVGYLVIPQEKDTDGFYHIWGFATQSDYNDYLTDKEAEAEKRLLNIAIPLLEEQGGVSNIVTLTRKSPANIVTSKKAASVEVAYLWQQYNPVTQETLPQDEDATITVSCRTQNASGTWGAWDTSKEFNVPIQSGQTKVIDLSGLLTSDATYQVRLVATGETSAVSTSPVTLTIVYSNVSVSYEGSIATAYAGNSIQLPFRVTGSVQKQLRIRINGYTKNFTLGATTYTDNTYGATLTQSEFKLTRGPMKAEVWVAFGEGYVAETERQELQFIYIPDGDTAKTPILAVSDVVTEFQNWTRATLFNYAVYNPTGQDTGLVLTLQDRDTGQLYLRYSVDCRNGVAYSFDENFSLERDGDEQPTVINAQLSFTDTAGVSFGSSLYFVIDNSENFAPTKGANVVLSPEKQSLIINGEQLPIEGLLNDNNDTNTGWKTSLETDCEGKEVSVPVLTVGAGNRLTLPIVLFDSNTGHNTDGLEGSMTLEFDIKTKNLVGDSPVIDASAPFNASYTGLKFYPTRAVCLSRNNFAEDICDAHFQEEVREHVAINIIRNLRGEGMNLVRIYINGKANRSFIYTDDDSFTPIGEEGAQSLVIGSDEADVDVYGIRIYLHQQLGSTQIQNDYMASMPTIEDKKLFKRFNSIYNGSEIGYDLCNALGLNTILRRIPEGGHYPSRENQSKQANVTVDVRIYKERGNSDSLDMKHSGMFTGMTSKGQGTSAMGYYWWNISDGFADDEEITADQYDSVNPTHYTNNGKFYRKVSFFNSLDGTSQVYASEYEIEDGRGGITKLVGKCNYASPMQSHKLGAIWSYDELWQLLVNDGSDNRPILKDTHACCYEKPFLNFYQIGNGVPVFCGFQTWGSGKGDKKTFGYNKKTSPGYLCVSGADNGAIAALFQMPWVVNKNRDGAWEGNIYAKSVTINTGDIKSGYCYKAGNSDTLSFEVEIGNKYDGGETDKGVLRIADEAKGETEETLFTTFAEFANFVFACSPLLRPYAGTEEALIADSSNLSRDHQYWLYNSDESRYNVYYYNPATSKFARATQIPLAWGSDGRAYSYGSPKLTEQLMGTQIAVNTIEGRKTVTLEEAIDLLGIADMSLLNDCFIKARVAYFANHADAYLDIKDIIFHQAYLKLVAGTDNRAKNTYPWIDPAIDKLVRWKQDDLDTLLATDNQGRQTKPYHVLEHTKNNSGSNYWNGENNVLFTLIERAYADRLRNMMRDIFTHMAQICGSVEEYLQQRFYWVQEYFPAVAYNETSRVLYEAAQVKMMNGKIDVSQDPITQAVGDQLECEKQYMSRRLPMMMSWCEYETGGDGTLSFRSVNSNAGKSPVYDIEYTAYQYIYPKLAVGGKLATVYARVNDEWVAQDGAEPYLCSPGETVRLVLDTDSNTQFTLRWMHYAKSIGNLGSLPCGEDGNVNITGRRLRKLECWSTDGIPIEFHPRGIVISNCPSLEEIDFTNAGALAGTFSYNLPRLVSLRLGGTAFTQVSLPKTSTLASVVLPASIYNIAVEGQPSLSSLTVQGFENVISVKIVGEHRIQQQTQTLIQLAYVEAHKLSDVTIDNVNWMNFPLETMMWLQGMGARLTGRIALTGNVTFSDKLQLAYSYGNIDDTDNALYLSYTSRTINKAVINGPSYLSEPGKYQFSIVCSPSYGNDIACKDGKPDVKWTLQSGGETFGVFEDPTEGVLTVVQTDTSNAETHYEIRCAITKTDGTVLEADYQIGFYWRMPKIGDFAYADGTFDDFYWHDKTVVGLVYNIRELWQGDDGGDPVSFDGYEKPSEVFLQDHRLVGYRIRITAPRHLTTVGSNGRNQFSNLFPHGLSNVNQPLWYNHAAEINKATGLKDYRVPEGTTQINVYGGTYLTDSRFDREGGALVASGYLDENQNDGFLDYAGRRVAENMWGGKEETLAIVKHTQRVLTEYVFTDANTFIGTYYTDDDGVDHEFSSVPSTYTELIDAMMTLVNANNNNAMFRCILYPTAYACHLYEPSVMEGEVLAEQYRSGNWYQPAIGELVRIAVFSMQSSTTGFLDKYPGNNGITLTASVIDNMISDAMVSETDNPIKQNVDPEHVKYKSYTNADIVAINRYFHELVESSKPVYAMAMWRMARVIDYNPIFAWAGSNQYWPTTLQSYYGGMDYGFPLPFYSCNTPFRWSKHNGGAVLPSVQVDCFL